ncbi:tyrosine-type recombinase/integrase [Facklamia tabacinasalis]|uniref:Tyrosine-type recombinase/integrase n=1 Tax=Ruoffia tabacinasalis TaxID=87458 RepID=A0ABS0LM55_9LACT|nr:tyrosine-type recombinase/integrase [Ruoffia tabacinasalis]
MFYILLRTGLRVSELCSLTWNDIDFENELINIK